MPVDNPLQRTSQTVCNTDQSPHWRVSATSVCGSSHEKFGIPCQDAHFWTVSSGDVLIAAVADGAGSATHSDLGAQIAAQTAVETLCTEPDLEYQLRDDPEAFCPLLRYALQCAKDAVSQKAMVHHITMRNLASTLLIAIATPHLIATAQIGDGAIVASDKDHNLIALTTPDTGEYINQTTFLISPDAIDNAQLHIWHGELSNIALFSDGLQMLALTLPYGKPHEPFFSPLFRFISHAKNKIEEQQASFLSSPRVRSRTDDDLTLILAARTDCTHATQSQI